VKLRTERSTEPSDERTGGRDAALSLERVSRAFGALKAVDDVSLRVEDAERRAIIGPNGAGKTTLFNLISGDLNVTTGRILLFGSDVTRLPPHRRVALGIGRTFQITNIFPKLTVEENVILAAQGLLTTKFALHRSAGEDGRVRERVDRTLEEIGLTRVKSETAGELSHGEQRQVELALALASEPRLLLLDEPGAGLAAQERALMRQLIQNLSRDLTIVLIEHDMDLALGLVDRVFCLHYGQVIAEETPERIRENERVQEVYLGAG
jgi:branched-chain amino acid transport system ATP-binding protein